MKISTIATALSALCLPMLGLATMTVENGTIAGYTMYIPQWEVEITPGGDKMVFNGTVQEVHQQILQHNSKWDTEFNFQHDPPAALAGRGESSGDFKLAKRNDFLGHDSHCFKNKNWDDCKTHWISVGATYLRGIKGTPTNGAGPGNCGRVSCSWGAAIYWCNDSKESKTLDSYSLIADGADHIAADCRHEVYFNPSWFWETQGQTFHDDNWNVIVRGDSC